MGVTSNAMKLWFAGSQVMRIGVGGSSFLLVFILTLPYPNRVGFVRGQTYRVVSTASLAYFSRIEQLEKCSGQILFWDKPALPELSGFFLESVKVIGAAHAKPRKTATASKDVSSGYSAHDIEAEL